MICSRCGLDLPAGSVHISEMACIEALKTCSECGEEITIPIHPGCAPHLVAKRVAGHGTSALGKKIVDGIAGLFDPKPPTEGEGGPPPERRDGGGKRWKP